MSDQEERNLVREAREGDRDAFGKLVRMHQRRIHALGRRLLGTAEDADDLVQETFLRAWKALERFDAERPLAPWLVRIATNRAMTLLEVRQRRPVEELEDTVPDPGDLPDEATERRRLHERVRQHLEGLPEDQRAILVLRATDQLSYREIADTLDIPIGTVMSRLARARETMRKRMKR
ncbi:MAG: sigma-70 family RNA polymerase sigma factor [Gemmatimonadetes bacterium]|nr:sigma-70 family RNA polymerase sigma factor [Gemmatimonadota bacterium]